MHLFGSRRPSEAKFGLRRGTDAAGGIRAAARYCVELRHFGWTDPAGLNPGVAVQPQSAKNRKRQQNHRYQDAFLTMTTVDATIKT